jgi:apolipoprotein N-acyltransferase
MRVEQIRALARRTEVRIFGAALLSGVLVASLWLPPQRPWAVAIAFVPLIASWLRAQRYTEVLLGGFLCQWIISAIAFSWIAPSVRAYHDLSLPAAIACWLLAAAVTNLHIPMIGLAWWHIRRRYALSAYSASALLAAMWVGLSQLYPTFVPFDYGYPWLWSELPVLHLADWVGFRGLAVITLLVNALLAFAWCAPAGRERRALVVAAASVLLVANAAGFVNAKTWDAGDRSLRVALIQPSFSWDESMEARAELRADARRVQSLLRTSAEHHALRPADLWIWPESSVLTPLGPGTAFDYQRWLSSLFATQAVPILAGVNWRAGPGTVHNSAVLFDRQGQVGGTYHKEQLFPFGEYLPLIGRFIEGRVRYATPEQAQGGVVSSEGVRLGISICFEALFPDLLRGRADEGAQILVNLSNDQPFGNTGERHQHYYMAMARAIELRRPLVRVALTGVSAVVDRTGRVITEAGMDRAWSETVSVPFASAPAATVFQRFGHLFQHACLISTLWTLLALELRSRSRRVANGVPVATLPLRDLRQAWRRARSVPARRVACLALIMLGVSQAVGSATGWSALRHIGLLSGAAPLPLVFGAVNGYEYWAGEHALDVRLAGGERTRASLNRASFSALPGPHRMHMWLAMPFMVAPIAPPAVWKGMLEHALCREGPLARAAALGGNVESATLSIRGADGRRFRGSVACRR